MVIFIQTVRPAAHRCHPDGLIIINNLLVVLEFEELVDIPELEGEGAEEKAEDDKAYSGEDDDCGDARAERVEEDEDGKDEEDDRPTDDPACPRDAEGVKVTGEGYHHEAVVHNPETHHDRKHNEGDTGIDAEEETEKEIYHSSDKHISPHHEEVGAGRGGDQLGRAGQEHQDTEKDAQCNIALKRESKNSDAGSYRKQTGNRHEPPMLYSTAGSLSQVFKSTFHNTKINQCSECQLLC